MEKIYRYIDEHAGEFVETLQRFCRQPSISSEGVGIREMVAVLKEEMESIGVETTVHKTPGNPLVTGIVRGESSRSILFYNHYDIQPPDPVEKWDSPPFAAEIREGRVWSRGATDNKGNILSRLKAVEAFLKVEGKLPVTVKFLFDGEEENGSPSLLPFVRSHGDLLAADGAIWEDGAWKDRPNQPVIDLGNKGLVSFELSLRTANVDLHSSMAPIYENACWRLAWAMASLKGPDEKVLVEGFYDDVIPVTGEEEEMIREIPIFDEEERLQRLAMRRMILGLAGTDLMRRLLMEPTCNISGFAGGYTGKGRKTAVASEAQAKIDMRLVPQQRAMDIYAKVRRHLDKNGFSDVQMSAPTFVSEPSRPPHDSHIVKAIQRASRKVYGEEPILKPQGIGGTPSWVVTNNLHIPMAGTGLGRVTAQAHGHNENLVIQEFIECIKYMATIMKEFGK
jgi:acetylornithine deacetylase/succinyl-diaminopimelate desuccinylase-like protein